nr:Ltp family lipoprotein [Micrococcus sp. KRD026]
MKGAAQYQSALRKAYSYEENMDMSKMGIYGQLVSEYGEQFSPEAAQYAIDNMTDVDWNANALAKAKSYQEMMDMSPSAIYDQLVSEYGEEFTPDQAQYAIDNLSQ